MATAGDPITVATIKDKIRRMGVTYEPGNSSKVGHLYSPLPFKEFADVPHQRGCVERRFEAIRKDLGQFVERGRLLDVGCHAGFNCFKFNELGFQCTGIERDSLTVEIAQDTATLFGRPIKFICSDATPELIRQLGRFDVVIFTAVFQWVTAASGFDAAVELLKTLVAQSDVLYFETSMGNEGKAKMPMLPDIDAVEQLLRKVGHKHITRIADLDRSRYLFRSSRMTPEQAPVLDRLKRAVAKCERTEPLYAKRNAYFFSRVWKQQLGKGPSIAVKLVEALDERAAPLLRREHQFLNRIDSPHVPKLLAQGKYGPYYMMASEWIDGRPLSEGVGGSPAERDAIRRGLAEIRQTLRNAGIVHRDVRETNLLLSDGRLMLLDFGWARWAHEQSIFTPPELVEPDDERAFARIDRVLRYTQQVSATPVRGPIGVRDAEAV